MKDLDWAAAFLARFAYPLASGGVVSIGMPLLQKGADRLIAAAPGLANTSVGQSLAKAQRQQLGELGIVDAPSPFSADPTSLWLLSALHDALFLFHPRGQTLSQGRREGLIQQVRGMLTTAAQALPEPSQESALEHDLVPKLTARYTLLAGLWTLRPKSGEPLPRPGASLETDILALSIDKEDQTLVHYLGMASPLTQLLRPPPAPLSIIELLPWLQVARLARLFVTVQLRHGSLLALSRVGRVVQDQLEAPRDAIPDEHLATLLGIFSLFHLRVALAQTLQAIPAVHEPLHDSLALFATLAKVVPELCFPRDLGTSGPVFDSVQRHLQLCQLASPPDKRQRLVALCSARFPRPATMTNNTQAMDNR